MALTGSKLCRIVAFLLLLAAALGAFGLAHLSVEGLALLGLGFWALSGAVD